MDFWVFEKLRKLNSTGAGRVYSNCQIENHKSVLIKVYFTGGDRANSSCEKLKIINQV